MIHPNFRTILFVASVAFSFGCSRGRWATDGEQLRRPQTLCDLARAHDVVAHGEIISAGASREVEFKAWPGRPVLVTPLTIRVDRDLKGHLSPGLHEVLVSARAVNGRLQTRRVSPIPATGWIYAGSFDGKLLMMADGLVHGGVGTKFDTQFFGEFPDEAAFEVRQAAAIAACARVDLFSKFTPTGEVGAHSQQVRTRNDGGIVLEPTN